MAETFVSREPPEFHMAMLYRSVNLDRARLAVVLVSAPGYKVDVPQVQRIADLRARIHLMIPELQICRTSPRTTPVMSLHIN